MTRLDLLFSKHQTVHNLLLSVYLNLTTFMKAMDDAKKVEE
jgi:hypothetical protein